MSVMEISIKWNVCRICLAEERQSHAKYILIDSKIARQIYDIAGVQMDKSDQLPDKICRKCLLLLKYACHFSTTCRNSDEYLQSVIQKTRSATSMLKMDKRRERSVEFLEEMFNEDVGLISPNEGDDEQQDSTTQAELQKKHEQLGSSTVLPEKIADTLDNKEIFQTQLIRTVPRTSTVLKMQQSQSTDRDAGTTNYVITKQIDKNTSSNPGPLTNNVLNKTHKVEKCSDQEFLYVDCEENGPEDFNGSRTNYKRRPTRVCKSNSDCSLGDFGYIDEDEKQVDALDIINEHNEYSLNNEVENKEDEINNTVELNTKLEIENPTTNSLGEQEQQTDELFYIIEEPLIKVEDSSNSQNLDVEEDVIAEEETTMQLIDDLTVTDGGEDGEEPVYENCETNRTMVQLEEYLIDESETEPVSQQDLETNEEQVIRRASTTTIKIRDREQRVSPHGRKKGNVAYMFSCDVCGNNFTSRSLRNYHMRIHRKEKMFECELCFKRFTAACNLTAHMRIHTGEKPYECKYCFRRFTDRSTHVKHERVHTNEKPFQCNTCGKSFALSTTLRTHEKVHTNEKPFKCEPCNKSFKLPHQLKSHLHTNQHKNIVMASELGSSEYDKLRLELHRWSQMDT